MSIGEKQALMSEIARSIGDSFPSKDVEKIMSSLSDILVNYDVTICGEATDDSESLLTAFIETKNIEGCSKATLRVYGYTLRHMIRTLKIPMSRVTVYHLRNYLMDLRKSGVQDSTLETYRYSLMSFFGWLKKEHLIQDDPCENLNKIRCMKKIRVPFTNAEIEQLKEACKRQRDRAIVCFLLSTGCRIGEVCSLNRDDVDFQNLECIVCGKGNKERTVYLDEVAALHLKRYLASRNDVCPALFIGRKMERLGSDGIRTMLHNIERETGIENVHPHRFRRTLATNLINRGMPIQDVAAILGHDRIDTTMTYIYQSKAKIKTAYQKYA